jgi:site-specific DNA-methyltransferase (adenine-specific)
MTPYYSDSHCEIYHGRWEDVMPALSGRYSAIVTDPPYGTGGWRRGTAGAGGDPSASLVREDWDVYSTDWIDGSVPVITFTPCSSAHILLSHAASVGLSKHRLLVWEKPDPKPQFQNRVKWSLEPVWVLSPEGFTLHGDTDLYRESSVRMNRDAEALGHQYQKPLDVMRWIVGKTEASPILDPFMGSGTTLRAAKDLGRKSLGVEMDEAYCEMAAKRLSQEVLGL